MQLLSTSWLMPSHVHPESKTIPYHSTIPPPRKKINSIPGKTRTGTNLCIALICATRAISQDWWKCLRQILCWSPLKLTHAPKPTSLAVKMWFIYYIYKNYIIRQTNYNIIHANDMHANDFSAVTALLHLADILSPLLSYLMTSHSEVFCIQHAAGQVLCEAVIPKLL